MRTRWFALAFLMLAACRDSTSPRRDDTEIPRGDWRVLVERFSRAGERSFYSMAPDGSMVAAESGLPSDALMLAPSPDGHTIAWLRPTELDVHLWLMDRDGGDRRPVLEGVRAVEHVGWSPDGNRLVVQISTLEDTDDIWVMNLDGSGATNLTPDAGTAVIFDREPAWSPDGASIAFTSNRSGTTRLWIMDADGANPRQVIASSIVASELSPAWSTDGARIAFRTAGDGGAGIGIVRPDGTDRRVFPVAGNAGRVAWTPDGRVMFSANLDGDYEIYAMHPETGTLAPLTSHDDHDWRAVLIRYVSPAAWRGFGAPARYATNRPEPPGVVIGDIIADGVPDLMLLAPSHEEVRVLKGTGGGAFQALGSVNAFADQGAAVVADVSRDGVDDLIVLGPDFLSLWRGSDVGPGVATTHAFTGDGRGLAAADFDRDGSADVASIYQIDGIMRLVVFSARSDDGAFIPVLDYPVTAAPPGRACAADFTGEGAVDVMVVTGEAATPLVLIPGRGDISFGDAVEVTGRAVAADVATIPVCADFDGDRQSDLALLRPGSGGGLSVLRSSGSALLGPQALPVKGTSAAAADVDRDGDVDLLVAGESGSEVLFLRNRGDGRFVDPARIPVGGQPLRVATEDLDGDEWPDLVVADRDGSIAVLLNRRRD